MSLENIWRALGESKAERRVKILTGVSKTGTNNVLIIKSQILKMRGVKI